MLLRRGHPMGVLPKAFLTISILVSSILYSFSANAMILPPNDLHRYDRKDRIANITEEQFHQIVDSIVEMWRPIAAEHGADLVAEKLWDNPTVNAYATQSMWGKKTWKITMFGGLARRPEVTPDGFALVVCHELGHHFGGYPFYGNRDWAAAEGEA